MSIYKALAEAKKKIKPFKKDSYNPFYKSHYADLDTIKQTVDPALSECGLMIVSRVTPVSVITSLVHIELGDAIDSEFPLTPNLDAQKRGSEITYARRYSLQSLLDLVAEDDDGNQASKVDAKTKPKDEFNPIAKHKSAMEWIPTVSDVTKLMQGWMAFQTFADSFKTAGKEALYNEVANKFKERESVLKSDEAF